MKNKEFIVLCLGCQSTIEPGDRSDLEMQSNQESDECCDSWDGMCKACFLSLSPFERTLIALMDRIAFNLEKKP